MENLRTFDNRRAEYALSCIKEVSLINGANSTFFVGLPVTIMTNGLTKTFAILQKDKAGKVEKKTADLFFSWLIEMGYIANIGNTEQRYQELIGLSSMKYISAQAEILKLSDWLKKYARVFLKDKKNEEAERTDES